MKPKTILNELPGYVQFETNTRCNQRCRFCTHNDIPNREMSMDMIESIIFETIPGAHTCCPFWFQDPLMEPRLVNILKLIRATNARCRTMLYSTMHNMNKNTMQNIVENVLLDDLYVSLYSERTQPGLNMERATKNVRYITDAKDMLMMSSPRITMMMIMDIHNEKEIDAWERQWRWKDVVLMRVPFDTLGGKVNGLHDEIGHVERTHGPNYYGGKRKPCSALWNTLNINADGDIMPCCVATDKRYSFGNVKDCKILDTLNGEKAVQMRQDHINGKFEKYDICKNCTKWEW
jgi:radical SAM protein with 4Fe4S-binding SPASM domain